MLNSFFSSTESSGFQFIYVWQDKSYKLALHYFELIHTNVTYQPKHVQHKRYVILCQLTWVTTSATHLHTHTYTHTTAFQVTAFTFTNCFISLTFQGTSWNASPFSLTCWRGALDLEPFAFCKYPYYLSCVKLDLFIENMTHCGFGNTNYSWRLEYC